MGRSLQSGHLERGLEARHSFLLLDLGELDHEDGVFAGQADQHDEADLRENVGIHFRQHHAGDRTEQTHRYDEDHRERQRPAFVLRRQHQENQDHRQDEDEHAGVAGLQLEQRQLLFHSKCIDGGNSLRAIVSMAWMASPELTPGRRCH